MFAWRNDGARRIEKTKERRAHDVRIQVAFIGRGEDTLQFGDGIAVKIVEILFFERGSQTNRMREFAAFLRDRAGACFLHGKKRANLILKLRVESFLMS